MFSFGHLDLNLDFSCLLSLGNGNGKVLANLLDFLPVFHQNEHVASTNTTFLFPWFSAAAPVAPWILSELRVRTLYFVLIVMIPLKRRNNFPYLPQRTIKPRSEFLAAEGLFNSLTSSKSIISTSTELPQSKTFHVFLSA